MNSIKSTLTVLFLLAVSYGVYRLIHTPDSTGMNAPNLGLNESIGNRRDAISSDALAQPIPNLNSQFEASSPRLAAAPPLVKTFDNSQGAAHPPVNPILESKSNEPDRSAYAIETPSAPMPIPDSPLTKLIPAVPPSTGGNATVSGTINPPEMPDGTMSEAGKLPDAMTQAPDAPNEETPTENPSTQNELVASPLVDPTTNLNSQNTLPARQAPLAGPTDLEAAWPIVNGHMRNGEIASALQVLSGYYHSNLSDTQREELLTWLDALAGKVIYSTEDKLSPTPHVVQQGETLDSIAQNWNIPKDLLININRTKLPPDQVLTAGLELKVVRGPFRAEIDSQRKELTLFLDKYYAGRFPIDTSMCTELKPGQCEIKSMSIDPVGQYRMDLGSGISLTAGAPRADSRSIQLNVADAKDVWSILSSQSQVTVVR